MYVDANASLILITTARQCDGKAVEWMAHMPESDVLIKRSGAAVNWITRGDLSGTYDGAGRITWNDADKWQRLNMSDDQCRVLTRRPYVPLTFIVISLAWSLFAGMADRLRRLV